MATGDRVQLIIPTSINVLTAVNETLVTLQRAGETVQVTLPSLRRRALMIVKELGVLPFQQATPEDDSFTR